MDRPDEEWLAAGSLSQDEFEQLVRLTARYFCYDVDQFDNWKMPGPWGSFYVSYSWEPATPDRRSDDGYRMMWPSLPPEASGFAVVEVAEDGTERELARFARESVAALLRDRRTMYEAPLDSSRTYLVRPV